VSPAEIGDLAVRTARAEYLLELGRAAEARAQIAAVLASEPDDARAQRLLVRCLLQLDDPQTLDASKRAVVLAPDNDQSHRLASLAHTAAGLHDLAVQHAREAVRLAPHEWRAHHVLTHALTATDPEAALAAGQDGIRVAPAEPAMHLVLGLAALRAKRNTKAKEAFRTVLRLDPDNATARNNLAIVDLRTGRFGEAMDGFGAALAADPRLSLARGNLDAVTLTMLMKLRYFVVASEFLSFHLIGVSTHASDQVRAAALLILWIGLAGWGYSRVPGRLRAYALGIFRRRRRAAVLGAVIVIATVGVVLGPLTGVLSTGAGLAFGGIAALTILTDLFWYSRLRAKARAKRKLKNEQAARG
jgi:Flp pilus assembly protein TadD